MVAAIGVGIAILGAWIFAGMMITSPHEKGLDPNMGCAWMAAIFAIFATFALLDTISRVHHG